ncbi:hypothetical protein PHLGIDRAFT_326832 [Phlebiopsis gigantea 11061_1 CR5-6]|uniref:Uncharacterized protein n=1 Tax=Phlebiopsis gigantea (strain 11061_1 CR5-6) TaxID=745531 RepID=A0A0C3RZF4_PHLG1|nr:hypothetical protein PHLGIDRAFT_326832 [Phlebiopsis gigantea 11061_1 CR5-6]
MDNQGSSSSNYRFAKLCHWFVGRLDALFKHCSAVRKYLGVAMMRIRGLPPYDSSIKTKTVKDDELEALLSSLESGHSVSVRGLYSGLSLWDGRKDPRRTLAMVTRLLGLHRDLRSLALDATFPTDPESLDQLVSTMASMAHLETLDIIWIECSKGHGTTYTISPSRVAASTGSFCSLQSLAIVAKLGTLPFHQALCHAIADAKKTRFIVPTSKPLRTLSFMSLRFTDAPVEELQTLGYLMCSVGSSLHTLSLSVDLTSRSTRGHIMDAIKNLPLQRCTKLRDLRLRVEVNDDEHSGFQFIADILDCVPLSAPIKDVQFCAPMHGHHRPDMALHEHHLLRLDKRLLSMRHLKRVWVLAGYGCHFNLERSSRTAFYACLQEEQAKKKAR